MQQEYDMVEFKEPKDWRQWLEDNHSTVDGIWLRMYKKASGVISINYDQALDDALCYGWIDGLVNKFDEISYIQKFTPRRKRSMWSKRNIEHITRLTEEGLMKPSGVAEVDRAKADGRWDAAYDGQSNMVIPDDFLVMVRGNKKASEFFDSLNKTNLFAIGYQLQTAKKPETRERRMAKLLGMLENCIKPS